jgi:hypothetical protein
MEGYFDVCADSDKNEYFTPQRTPVRFLKPPVRGNKTIVI